MPRHASPLAILALALSVACDGTPNADAGRADSGVAPDTYSGPDYEVEEGWYPDEGLHKAPAACGASEYRWWGVSALGDVLERELKHTFTAPLINSFRQSFSQTAILSRDPEYTAALYRVRYQTQDRGSLTDATGMIAYPLAPAAGELPVLVYLHGTEGFTDQCAPSFGIEGAFSPNYLKAGIVGMFASWGYIVVAPDYIGMRSMGEPSEEFHPYLVGEPTAIATLDGLRAAEKLLEQAGADVAFSDDIVLYGISQGGHAAAFTTRYQPYYAPEYDIKGAVYSVPPLDLVGESAAGLSQATPVSLGNSAAFLVGAEDWYEAAGNDYSALFNPEHVDTVVAAVEDTCGAPALPGLTTDTLFTEAVREGTDPVGCYINENSVLHSSVPMVDDIPGLVILGDSDELVNTPVERTAFGTLCEMGMQLEYVECANASHLGGAFFSIDDAFDFIERRIADAPMSNACETMPARKCASDPR